MIDCYKVPINDVELDLDNPRIKQFLEMYGDNITSEGIALALSSGSTSSTSSTYSALKESIKVNGGIINPIVINKQPDGRMVVIEGNTRLQIYKEFAESNPNGPWNEIMAVIYDNLSLPEIHAIRLQTHLVGPREWDPFSKAKYLHQLSEIDRLPLNTIISYCGGKSSEINKFINAYKDMIKYYTPEAEQMGIDSNPQEFSKFAELQNSSIQNSLIAHGFSKTDFAKWVVNGNIDSAQNVRKIPAVLASSKAREVFLKSTVSEAIKYLNAEEKGSIDISKVSMYALANELTKRIWNLSRQEQTNLTYDIAYSEKKNDLKTLNEVLTDLISDIEGD